MIKAVIFDYGGVVSRNLRLQSEVLSLVRELQKWRIKTAILSNMTRPIAWFANRRGYFNEFDPVVVSCQVGCSKPNPQIYRILIKKLGVRPNECIYIDNKLENLLPARKLGMKTILARGTNQVVSDIKLLTNI